MNYLKIRSWWFRKNNSWISSWLYKKNGKIVLCSQEIKSACVFCFFYPHFSMLVNKFLPVVVKMTLRPCLHKMAGLNLLNMWKWIMWEIVVNHNENSHIKYLRNKVDMIHFLTYVCFCHLFIWKTFLVGSNIVLQLLVSVFLTVISFLNFLLLVRIFTNVALKIIKLTEWMVTE